MRRLSLPTVLAFLIQSGLADAQEALEIKEPRGGLPFQIVLDTLTVLRDNGEGIGPAGGRIAVDGQGRYFAGPTFVPGTIGIWSPTGKFLGKIGREGEGPGELGMVQTLWFGAEGRLYVLSYLHGLDVFRPDLEFIERHPQPSFTSREVVALQDGGFVRAGFSDSPSLYGRPVHVYAGGGERLRSIGTRFQPAYGRNPPWVSLAMTSDSTLWVGLAHRYRLEHLTLGGEQLGVVARSVDWFPDPGIHRPAADPSEKQPMLVWIHADSEDRIWMALSRPRGGKEYDRVYEVIDPTSGVLLGRLERSGFPIAGFAAKDLAFAFEELESGEVHALILRPRLIPK